MAEMPEIPDPLQRMLDNLQKVQDYFRAFEKHLADVRQAERDEAPDLEVRRKAANEYRKTMEEDILPEFSSIVDLDDFLRQFVKTNPQWDSLIQKILFKKKELVAQHDRLFMPRKPRPRSPIKKPPNIKKGYSVDSPSD